MKRFRARVALLIGGMIAMTQAQVQAQAKTEGGADAIRPFKVHFPDEELADLKRRIAATRWPDREIVTDQSQGVQLATVQKLARYWANYDWRKCEARLVQRETRVSLDFRFCAPAAPIGLDARGAGSRLTLCRYGSEYSPSTLYDTVPSAFGVPVKVPLPLIPLHFPVPFENVQVPLAPTNLPSFVVPLPWK